MLTCGLTKLQQGRFRAGAWLWFLRRLGKALVLGVNRLMLVRIVRFRRSTQEPVTPRLMVL